jgi:hypothetical protein
VSAPPNLWFITFDIFFNSPKQCLKGVTYGSKKSANDRVQSAYQTQARVLYRALTFRSTTLYEAASAKCERAATVKSRLGWETARDICWGKRLMVTNLDTPSHADGNKRATTSGWVTFRLSEKYSACRAMAAFCCTSGCSQLVSRKLGCCHFHFTTLHFTSIPFTSLHFLKVLKIKS